LMHEPIRILIVLLLVSIIPNSALAQDSFNSAGKRDSLSLRTANQTAEISNGPAAERILESEEGSKESGEGSESRAEVGTYTFYVFLGTSIGLTLVAGLMSGLTVGYLSIDKLVLELKIKNGNEEEKRQVRQGIVTFRHKKFCQF